MNKDKWSKGILISGLILIFITAIIYFIEFKNIINTSMVLASFLFVIIAEILTILIVLKTKREILRLSIVTTAVLYLLSTIVLALVVNNFMMLSLNSYIIVNIILIGITSVVIVNLNIFVIQVNEKNNKILEAEHLISECAEKIQYYINNFEYGEYKKELNNIYDDLRYSDISSKCGMESTLLKKIESISEYEEDLSEYLKEIKVLIKERNLKLKNTKKGTI